MSYYEMFMLYVGISLPFMLSLFVQVMMLSGKRKALPYISESLYISELTEVLDECDEVLRGFPQSYNWLVSLILTIFALIVSLFGLVWVTSPQERFREMSELLQWKFKEI